MKALPFVAIVLLAGCTLGPSPREAASVYDLGPPQSYSAAQPRIGPSLLVQDIGSPAWLNSTAIVYRLHYRDPARQFAYAHSRWASSPGSLLAQKLRSRLAAASAGGVVTAQDNARADYALRIELEDFSQVFDSAVKSRGVAVARASLVDASRRTLSAQQVFTVEKPADSADAEGGVRALTAASDELAQSIAGWVAANLASAGKPAPAAASK
jgi:cholesterol transport system auxiliary component